jgi:hypothetical protein
MPESLLPSMKEAVQRREKISVGTHTLLFCDSHLEDTYEAFDFASTSITTAIAALTGCPKIRQHDLRVAATTDIAFELEAAINKLANGENILQPSCWSPALTPIVRWSKPGSKKQIDAKRRLSPDWWYLFLGSKPSPDCAPDWCHELFAAQNTELCWKSAIRHRSLPLQQRLGDRIGVACTPRSASRLANALGRRQ